MSSSYPFTLRQDGQKEIKVDLYENNCIDRELILNDANCEKYNVSKIFDEPFEFSEGEVITKHTQVTFSAHRDKDGIIEIRVVYLNNNPKCFRIPTIKPILSEENELHVLQSIRLMDIQQDECK